MRRSRIRAKTLVLERELVDPGLYPEPAQDSLWIYQIQTR